LSAHPDIDLFYALSDDMAAGCAKAVATVHSHAKILGNGGAKLGIQGSRTERSSVTSASSPRTRVRRPSTRSTT